MNKVDIPTGIKLPYRPEVKVGDEILVLDDDPTSTEVLAGLTFKVIDRVEVTGAPVVMYDDDRYYLDDPADSWAIVSGGIESQKDSNPRSPVEKDDWVIVLEWWVKAEQPLGHLAQVAFIDQAGDLFLTHATLHRGSRGTFRIVNKWAKVDLLGSPDPNQAYANPHPSDVAYELPEKPGASQPEYRIGDRVEVYGYTMAGWSGPATVRVVFPEGLNVEMDEPTGCGFQAGFFPFKNIRPLKEDRFSAVAGIPETVPLKLADLKLGAVIRDNSDGAMFMRGTTKNYGDFGSPFDGEVTGESPIWRTLGGEVAFGRLIDDFTVLYAGYDNEEKAA